MQFIVMAILSVFIAEMFFSFFAELGTAREPHMHYVTCTNHTERNLCTPLTTNINSNQWRARGTIRNGTRTRGRFISTAFYRRQLCVLYVVFTEFPSFFATFGEMLWEMCNSEEREEFAHAKRVTLIYTSFDLLKPQYFVCSFGFNVLTVFTCS